MGIESQAAPAGWYPDSGAPGQLRFWDGIEWTEYVAEPHPAGGSANPGELPGPASDGQGLNGDLTANKPGDAARRRAVQLREEAPVRTALARVLRVHTQERAFRKGADGEEIVAKRLAKLGSDWRVLHAVPVGERGSDIDHVVIGPPGVFTLNTKNHAGKNVWVAERAFMVNGQRTDYLPKSRFEAKRASQLLSSACGFAINVEPVIVLIAAQLTVKRRPSGVHVVGRKHAVRWLREQPPVLTPEGVEEIFGRARMASTWTPTSKRRRLPS